MTPRHGADDAPAREPDASMTLLNEVYRTPVDPAYALASAQRVRTGERPSLLRRVAVLVVAALLGLGVTAATLALRQPEGSVVATRDLLEERITDGGDRVTALQEHVEELSAEVDELRSDVLGSSEDPLRDELAAGAVEGGMVAVTGRGLRVELSDAPNATTETPDLRVQDIDLQVLVNGLWAAGAEAVAVNGQRVTGTTAIRSAGDAVLVDLVPLTGPYRVEAVGDPVGMQTELARTTAGQHLATLRSSYGIGVEISSQRELELPGTGQVTLRSAEVPEDQLPDALRIPDSATGAPVPSPQPSVAVSAGRTTGEGS